MSRRSSSLLAFTVSLFITVGCQQDAGSLDEVLAKLEAIDKRLSAIESKIDRGAVVASKGGAPKIGTKIGGKTIDPSKIGVKKVDRKTKAQSTGAQNTGSPKSATTPVKSTGAKSTGSTVAGSKATPPATGEVPVFAMDERSFDFATVWSGDDIAHVFRVRNDGAVPLSILAATPSCTCVVLGDIAKSIRPGAEGEIPFQVETGKLKGNVRQTILLRTNDPKTPEIKLAVSGVVRPTVSFESFVLLRVRPHEGPTERRVKIRYHKEGTFSAKLLPRAKDRFGITLEEAEPGKEFELVIKVEPPFKIGYERTTVSVQTNLEEPKNLTIRVNLHIPDRIDVIPNQLLVDNQPTSPVARQLTLTNYGDNPVKVLTAKADDPKIGTVLAARKVGKVYAITVSIPAGYSIPAEGRKLILSTDDAEKPTVEIPIRAIRPRAVAQRPPATGGRSGSQKSGTPRKPKRRPALDLLDKQAPDFELDLSTGDQISSVQFEEAPATVLNFYAPNCGFCKRQIPLVEKARQVYEDRGIRFVNVTETMGRQFTPEETQAVLEGLDSRIEIAFDPGNRVGRYYKVTGFPTLFVVDNKGKIRQVTVGAKKNLDEMLSEKLEELMAEGG